MKKIIFIFSITFLIVFPSVKVKGEFLFEQINPTVDRDLIKINEYLKFCAKYNYPIVTEGDQSIEYEESYDIKAVKLLLKRFNKYKTELTNLLSQLHQFYGVENALNPKCYIIPYNRSTAKLYARSFNGDIYIPILLNSDSKIEYLLSTYIHEYSHLLFDALDNSDQALKDAQFAHYLDEAIATALGSSITIDAVFGKEQNGSWYDNYYINNFAKILSIKLQDNWGQNGHTFHSQLKSYHTIYRTKIKPQIKELDNVMKVVNVYCNYDLPQFKLDLYESLRSNYRILKYRYFNEINGLQKRHISKSDVTKLFLIKENPEINRIGFLYGKDLSFLEIKGSFVYAFYCNETNSNVIIRKLKTYSANLDLAQLNKFGYQMKRDMIVLT